MNRISVIAEWIASWLCFSDATHSSAVDGPILFASLACFREENDRAGNKEDSVRWVANNVPEAETARRIILASEKVQRVSHSTSG